MVCGGTGAVLAGKWRNNVGEPCTQGCAGEPDPLPVAWVIEGPGGVTLTHYPMVADKHILSPLHIVTPYYSKAKK